MTTDETTYKIKLSDGTNVLLRDFYNSNYASFSLFASGYLTDKEEIEDVVQEAFISFWEQDIEFQNLITIKLVERSYQRNLTGRHLIFEKSF